MAQTKDTLPCVQESHGLVKGQVGEVKSPNAGQHQPLWDLNLLPTTWNGDYSAAHTHLSISGLSTPRPHLTHIVLLS